MIKNRQKLQKFEKEILKNEKVDFLKNYKIVEAMYKEAIELGIIPMKEPLYGLEVDMKVAKVINSVSKTS
ncbi:MAG: hypothetical protein AB1779_11360 [Candidatus Thermoplasmatota archaeon]